MINLLPPEEKRQLRAARANSLLLRYNTLLVGAAGFTALALIVTYLYLSTAQAGAQATISENKDKVKSYAQVESQAQLFRTNLATAKQILDRDVAYTKIVVAIAQLLPAGTVLQGLNLNSQTFGTETVLAAQVKDYDAALRLKDSLQSSNLLSNVHFQSITAGAPGAYPITVNLLVTIKKGIK